MLRSRTANECERAKSPNEAGTHRSQRPRSCHALSLNAVRCKSILRRSLGTKSRVCCSTKEWIGKEYGRGMGGLVGGLLEVAAVIEGAGGMVGWSRVECTMYRYLSFKMASARRLIVLPPWLLY